MANVIELAQAKANAITRQKELLVKAETEDREMTTEEYDIFQSLNKEIDDCGVQIRRQEAREVVETHELEAAKPRPRVSSPQSAEFRLSDREKNRIWNTWALGKRTNPDNELRYKAAEYGLPLDQDRIEFSGLDTGTTGSGKEWVGNTFIPQLEQVQKWYTPLLSYCTVITTGNGEKYTYIQTDDTSNKAVTAAERSDVSSETDPTSASIDVTPTKYRSKLVVISAEELEDSSFNLPAYLSGAFGERHGRAYATDGTSTLVSGISSAVHLASGNAITLAKIYTLLGGLDIAYQPRARIQMNQKTWFTIAQMVDDVHRPLFPNLNSAVDKSLLGIPVDFNNELVDVNVAADNDCIILYGDFSKFWIRKVAPPRLRRYDELKALTEDCVAFQFFERVAFFHRLKTPSPAIVKMNAYHASSFAMDNVEGMDAHRLLRK